jgi:hypothetical protein
MLIYHYVTSRTGLSEDLPVKILALNTKEVCQKRVLPSNKLLRGE